MDLESGSKTRVVSLSSFSYTKCVAQSMYHFIFNPFLANVPIWYPVKTSSFLVFVGGYKIGKLATGGPPTNF